jgi:hypothetical protein
MTPSGQRHTDPLATLLRLVALSAIGGIVAGLAAFVPVRSIWGDAATVAMLAGLAVAVLGGWFGSIPIVLTINLGPAAFASGVLAGLGARFLATAVVAALVHTSGLVVSDAFLLSVGVMHLLILAVDVTAQIRLSRRVVGGAA